MLMKKDVLDKYITKIVFLAKMMATKTVAVLDKRLPHSLSPELKINYGQNRNDPRLC